MSGTRWIILIVVSATLSAASYWAFENHRIDTLSASARQAFEQREWSEAAAKAGAWTEAEPENAEAWFVLGQAHQKLEQWDQAIEAFDSIELADPRKGDALEQKIEILFERQALVFEAVEACRELLKIQPASQLAYARLLYFDALTFQHAAFLDDFGAAIAQRAETPASYIYLMTIDYSFYSDGVSRLQSWVDANPDSDLLVSALAVHRAKRIYRESSIAKEEDRLKLRQEAEAELSERLQDDPSSPAILEHLLLIADERSDVDAMAKLLQAVPDDAADDPVFWRYRGNYHALGGEHQKAADAYSQSLELFPLSWRTRQGLAESDRVAGRQVSATRNQKLAVQGRELEGDIKELNSMQEANEDLLREMLDFAESSEAWDIARGLHRRLVPVGMLDARKDSPGGAQSIAALDGRKTGLAMAALLAP